MLLTCPCCATSFRVSPVSIGAGREVRCARCEVIWFASPLKAEPEVAAKAEITPAAEAAKASVKEEEPAKEEKDVAAAEALSIIPDEKAIIVFEKKTEVAADAKALTLADKADEEEATAEEEILFAPELTTMDPAPPRHTARRAPKPKRPRDKTFALSAVTGFLALTVFCGIAARAMLVRAVPDLAGFYAAVGLGVNLRGLEFRAVRTAQATQDGIPVLVVEGEIANVTSQTVEIPKLRLAVLGKEGREIYAWTSQLPRSSLKEGEQMPFKSRLASPPPEARQVFVRFINRGDATGGIR
jgi:predicted Zn finger-like uncharacterized protein